MWPSSTDGVLPGSAHRDGHQALEAQALHQRRAAQLRDRNAHTRMQPAVQALVRAKARAYALPGLNKVQRCYTMDATLDESETTPPRVLHPVQQFLGPSGKVCWQVPSSCSCERFVQGSSGARAHPARR